jgi:hypothetical protein
VRTCDIHASPRSLKGTKRTACSCQCRWRATPRRIIHRHCAPKAVARVWVARPVIKGVLRYGRTHISCGIYLLEPTFIAHRLHPRTEHPAKPPWPPRLLPAPTISRPPKRSSSSATRALPSSRSARSGAVAARPTVRASARATSHISDVRAHSSAPLPAARLSSSPATFPHLRFHAGADLTVRYAVGGKQYHGETVATGVGSTFEAAQAAAQERFIRLGPESLLSGTGAPLL